MEPDGLLSVLRRHWLALTLALVTTVVATVGVALLSKPKYQSTVEMTMLNGPAINNEQAFHGNPYLSFDQTLSIDVDLLTRNLLSAASIQQLAELGVTEQLKAAFALGAQGPFMQLTATGPNPAHISRSMNVFINFAEQRWLQMQKALNAPANSIITLQTIAPPSPPATQGKSRFELIGGVAILGLIISLLVPSFIEGRSRRRAAGNVTGTAAPQRKRQMVVPAGPRQSVEASRSGRLADQHGDPYQMFLNPKKGRDNQQPSDDHAPVRTGWRKK